MSRPRAISLERAGRVLRDLTATGDVSAEAFARRAGVSRRTAHRYLSALKAHVQVCRCCRGRGFIRRVTKQKESPR